MVVGGFDLLKNIEEYRSLRILWERSELFESAKGNGKMALTVNSSVGLLIKGPELVMHMGIHHLGFDVYRRWLVGEVLPV